MSNPNHLPMLTGGLSFSDFQVAHLGPSSEPTRTEADWTAEAVLVTLESHYWLPTFANDSYTTDTSAKLEQLSDWVANWAEYGAEETADPTPEPHVVEGGQVVYKPVELPTLGEWLRDNLTACVEDGFYRTGPDGLRAAADLMECLNYLDEPWY